MSCTKPASSPACTSRLEAINRYIRKLHRIKSELESDLDEYVKASDDPDMEVSGMLVTIRRLRTVETMLDLLTAVRREILEGNVEITTETSYILPGGIYLVKKLLKNEITLEDALREVESVHARVSKFIEILDRKYQLQLIVPKNTEMKVKAWVDYIGRGENGNRHFALVLMFAFENKNGEIVEYEPVTFVFEERVGKYGRPSYRLREIYTRIHYDIYSYTDVKAPIRILFTSQGYTPKILKEECVPENPSPKMVLDYLWLEIGEWITKINGVSKKDLVPDLMGRIMVTPVLPRSLKNPFKTPIHPYFYPVPLDRRDLASAAS